jgi:hypothetical protein
VRPPLNGGIVGQTSRGENREEHGRSLANWSTHTLAASVSERRTLAVVLDFSGVRKGVDRIQALTAQSRPSSPPQFGSLIR